MKLMGWLHTSQFIEASLLETFEAMNVAFSQENAFKDTTLFISLSLVVFIASITVALWLVTRAAGILGGSCRTGYGGVGLTEAQRRNTSHLTSGHAFFDLICHFRWIKHGLYIRWRAVFCCWIGLTGGQDTNTLTLLSKFLAEVCWAVSHKGSGGKVVSK